METKPYQTPRRIKETYFEFKKPTIIQSDDASTSAESRVQNYAASSILNEFERPLSLKRPSLHFDSKRIFKQPKNNYHLWVGNHQRSMKALHPNLAEKMQKEKELALVKKAIINAYLKCSNRTLNMVKGIR